MAAIERWKRFGAFGLGAVAALAPLCAAPARAESLESALAAVYESSPALNAERARLRATDEELAKAQSGYRPAIGIDADFGVSTLETGVKNPRLASGADPRLFQIQQQAAAYKINDGRTNPGGYSVTVTQPLFEGFKTVNAVKGANASIMAGRESLRDAEQKTLLEAIKAYMGVLRDSSVMTLRQQSLEILSKEAHGTQERFAVGEMTRTDVAQAATRTAEAKAAVELAKATLRASLADYQRLVGHVPAAVTGPTGYEQHLPARIEDAIAAAVSRNPQVLAAAYQEKAAAFEVNRTLGEMLPQARFQASHNERFDPSVQLNQTTNESASVRVNIPLYQSGEIEARVRQAKQNRQGRIQEIVAVRETARAQAISAFAQIQALRAQVAAVRQQARAAAEGLAGVREEQKAGQRTLLDVLNAEQEQTNARIASVNAHHDLVIAAYSLLSAMGQLTAAQLDLGVPLYDAQAHYNQTNGRWSGTTIERESPHAARDEGWGASIQAQR